MNLNKDFALIDSEGYYRYPVFSKSKNGEEGYICNPYSMRVSVADRLHLKTIEEVIEGVIVKGWSVRVKRDASELPSGVKQMDAGARFGEREFLKAWASPAYASLLQEALARRKDGSSSEYLSKEAPERIDLNSENSRDEADLLLLKVAQFEVDDDPKCKDVTPTEREALVYARIGQGPYRKEMLSIWGHKCALTGLSVETALVASHAKPWKTSENKERTDPHNGLLLAATVDRLFDRGLISFSDDGQLLLGPQVTTADLELAGVAPGARLSDRLDEQHKPFLRAHRKLFKFE